LVISKPFNFKHDIHVTTDSESGFVGLPEEWEKILTNNLTKEQVVDNPEIAKNALTFLMSNDKNSSIKSKSEKGKLQDYILEEDPTTIFGKLTKLDEGCFGVVFKAKHLKSNIIVKFTFKISVQSKLFT
jgi:hypothetical protein